MKAKLFSTILNFNFILVVLLAVSCSQNQDKDFDERLKISLRQVGNQLLLSNQDSTTLIRPIYKLEPLKYSISFTEDLKIHPDTLVSIVRQNLKKSKLPENYRVEVVRCSDNRIAYSYQINTAAETTIIPCSGRILPKNCYIINIRFLNKQSTNFVNIKLLIGIIIFGVLVVSVLVYFIKKKTKNISSENRDYIKIGSFQFYVDQNKLIKEAKVIPLSKKECELLEIFAANANQIVKRDALTKKVWEDNGVFVGRSLDTFISKLRKKLSEDASLSIENIHGVGYKLVMSDN